MSESVSIDGPNPFRRATAVDQEIPTLSGVFDLEHLRDEVKPHLLSFSLREGGNFGQVRLQVLKWHPGRRLVLDIALRASIGWLHLIGKVCREDRSDVYDAMEVIWRAGFGHEAQFSIPRPLAYLSSLQLLLMEKAEGQHAEEVFVNGDEHQRAVAAERCAQWLARFHSSGPPQGRPWCVHDILAQNQHRARRIAEECAPLAGKAERLFERLVAAASAVSDVPMVAAHGDFGPAHVILTDGGAIAIDWDSYALADPSRDVARFMVNLQRLALRRLGSIRALEDAAARFQETYIIGAGRPEVAAHLPFYRAAFCLQRAKRDFHRQDPRSLEVAEALLDEGLRSLDSSVGG
jgi:aminoglycoside phosphotransferase (APT) family kinase protein